MSTKTTVTDDETDYDAIIDGLTAAHVEVSDAALRWVSEVKKIGAFEVVDKDSLYGMGWEDQDEAGRVMLPEIAKGRQIIEGHFVGKHYGGAYEVVLGHADRIKTSFAVLPEDVQRAVRVFFGYDHGYWTLHVADMGTMRDEACVAAVLGIDLCENTSYREVEGNGPWWSAHPSDVDDCFYSLTYAKAGPGVSEGNLIACGFYTKRDQWEHPDEAYPGYQVWDAKTLALHYAHKLSILEVLPQASIETGAKILAGLREAEQRPRTLSKAVEHLERLLRLWTETQIEGHLPADQLKALRTGAGLTQDALAKAVGVQLRQVQRWEAGESRVDFDTAMRVRAACAAVAAA